MMQLYEDHEQLISLSMDRFFLSGVNAGSCTHPKVNHLNRSYETSMKRCSGGYVCDSAAVQIDHPFPAGSSKSGTCVTTIAYRLSR